MTNPTGPVNGRVLGCCAQMIGSCAFSPLNSTIIKVILFVLSLIFVGAGTYGAIIAPHMWGSYIVIGMGVVAFLTIAVLTVTKFIAHALLALRREPTQRVVRQRPVETSTTDELLNTTRRVIDEHQRTAVTPVPVRDFQITDILSAAEIESLPEFATSDFKADAPPNGLACPPHVLEVFEKKKAAILRGKDNKGDLFVMFRYSLYDKTGKWMEDSVMQFIKVGESSIVISFSLKTSSLFLQFPASADSPQAKWLGELLHGQKVPLTSFIGRTPTVDANLTCALWTPPVS